MSDELESIEDDRKLRLKGGHHFRVKIFKRMRADVAYLRYDGIMVVKNLCFRTDDLHGQLENDDVLGYASNARFELVNKYRTVH